MNVTEVLLQTTSSDQNIRQNAENFLQQTAKKDLVCAFFFEFLTIFFEI